MPASLIALLVFFFTLALLGVAQTIRRRRRRARHKKALARCIFGIDRSTGPDGGGTTVVKVRRLPNGDTEVIGIAEFKTPGEEKHEGRS